MKQTGNIFTPKLPTNRAVATSERDHRLEPLPMLRHNDDLLIDRLAHMIARRAVQRMEDETHAD